MPAPGGWATVKRKTVSHNTDHKHAQYVSESGRNNIVHRNPRVRGKTSHPIGFRCCLSSIPEATGAPNSEPPLGTQQSQLWTKPLWTRCRKCFLTAENASRPSLTPTSPYLWKNLSAPATRKQTSSFHSLPAGHSPKVHQVENSSSVTFGECFSSLLEVGVGVGVENRAAHPWPLTSCCQDLVPGAELLYTHDKGG